MQGLAEQLAVLRDQNVGDPQLPVLERALRYHAAGDMRAAFASFVEAANNGSIGGLQNAALMIFNGLTDRPAADAIPMLESVAATGRPLSSLACYQLGCLHISRRPAFGLRKDSTTGLQLLHRAADQFGSIQASAKLARLYAVGARGVGRDQRLAAHYAAKILADPKRRVPIQIAALGGLAPIRDRLARSFILSLSRAARQVRRRPAASVAAELHRQVLRKGAKLLEQQRATLGAK